MSDKLKPTVVCLCGSTRFYREFQEANYRFTMGGMIVLSVGFYPHSQKQVHGQAVGCTSEQKVRLDELHKRKIDIADLVFVLNVGGYIGDSTESEIEYAERTDKTVIYFENGHEDGLPGIQRIEEWNRRRDNSSREDKIVRQATDAIIKQMHDVTERDFLDRAFLAWLYRRLETVHGERKDVDYMLRLRKIIDTPDHTTTLQQKIISDLMDERDKLAEALKESTRQMSHNTGSFDAIIESNKQLLKVPIGSDPASLGDRESVTMMKCKRGTVVCEKATGEKRCLSEEEILSYDEWELVCDRPHADGDYSYLCDNQWCRCQQ